MQTNGLAVVFDKQSGEVKKVAPDASTQGFKVVVTHFGVDSDNATSLAIALLLWEKCIIVGADREIKLEGPLEDACFLDMGGKLNPEKDLFDHHLKRELLPLYEVDMPNKRMEVKPSTVGLLFRYRKKEIIKALNEIAKNRGRVEQCFLTEERIEKIYKKIEQQLLIPHGQIDNDARASSRFKSLCRHFNDPDGNVPENLVFFKDWNDRVTVLGPIWIEKPVNQPISQTNKLEEQGYFRAASVMLKVLEDIYVEAVAAVKADEKMGIQDTVIYLTSALETLKSETRARHRALSVDLYILKSLEDIPPALREDVLLKKEALVNSHFTLATNIDVHPELTELVLEAEQNGHIELLESIGIGGGFKDLDWARVSKGMERCALQFVVCERADERWSARPLGDDILFPENWRGLGDDELHAQCQVPGVTFCHQGGRLLVGTSKEAVVKGLYEAGLQRKRDAESLEHGRAVEFDKDGTKIPGR